MSTEPEPNTVRLTVLRTYTATVPEPDWCAGHADDDPAQYRPDIHHFGPEHRLTFNGADLFKVMLAQSPFARNAGRGTCAYLEQAGGGIELDGPGLYDFAAALDSAADQLRDFADEHARLLGGEQ